MLHARYEHIASLNVEVVAMPLYYAAQILKKQKWGELEFAGMSAMALQHGMMMSSNGNIFRITGLLCGNSLVTDEFHTQSPVTRSFDVSFDLRSEPTVDQTVETLMIWDATALIITSL